MITYHKKDSQSETYSEVKGLDSSLDNVLYVNHSVWFLILWISSPGWRAKSDVGEESLFPPQADYSLLLIKRCRHRAAEGKNSWGIVAWRANIAEDIMSQWGEGRESSGQRRVDVWKLVHSLQGALKKKDEARVPQWCILSLLQISRTVLTLTIIWELVFHHFFCPQL